MQIRLQLPLTRQQARQLRCGDQCLLSGTVYTARDAAHARLCQALEEGSALPFPLENAVIYFVGPTPAPFGKAIGSAGPTTSYRMDAYSPSLIARGSTGMIGKGKRSAAVVDAMKQYGAVYFGATGGCGALLSSCIEKAEVVAYPELGPEAVRKLTVRDLPVTVVIDSYGQDLYTLGPQAYLQEEKNHEL